MELHHSFGLPNEILFADLIQGNAVVSVRNFDIYLIPHRLTRIPVLRLRGSDILQYSGIVFYHLTFRASTPLFLSHFFFLIREHRKPRGLISLKPILHHHLTLKLAYSWLYTIKTMIVQK